MRGFTMVELLVVVLIVGILAVVTIPIYLGYAKEAKLAEGKAMAGSVLTALQGCVQAKGPGRSDGRWTVGHHGPLVGVVDESGPLYRHHPGVRPHAEQRGRRAEHVPDHERRVPALYDREQHAARFQHRRSALLARARARNPRAAL